LTLCLPKVVPLLSRNNKSLCVDDGFLGLHGRAAKKWSMYVPLFWSNVETTAIGSNGTVVQFCCALVVLLMFGVRG